MRCSMLAPSSRGVAVGTSSVRSMTSPAVVVPRPAPAPRRKLLLGEHADDVVVRVGDEEDEAPPAAVGEVAQRVARAAPSRGRRS